MRINKYLALKNIASRREADTLVAAGKVFVNGKKAVLGIDVSETDVVEIRGTTKKYVYYAYNKPVGIVTSTPTKGETDIIHHTAFPEKVFPVGRLDKDSHGLIIMTNDGRLTKKLLDPEAEHEKEYLVTIDQPITPLFTKSMTTGVEIVTNTKARHQTKPAKLKKLSPKQFSITLTEGKNRQIRRMCETLGYKVTDLKRIRIGKILLGDLRPGKFVVIQESSLK